MRIKVKALPVQDVVRDIAKQWKQDLQEESGEIKMKIPENMGEGYIRCSNFELGIGVIEYRCKFYKDFEFIFTKNDTHPLKFIFCSEGNADHAFEEDDDTHTIHTYQNVIVSSSAGNGHLLKFKANEPANITSIEIMRSEFSKRNNYNFQGLDENLKALFEDSVSNKKFFYQGNYSIKAADIVEDINDKSYQGFLRSIFLQGKLYEMLAVQIKQYQDDQGEDNVRQILRRSDVVKVEKAVRIINHDPARNQSVEALAKEVGTNINKLQDGFKCMFNLTVNKYIQQVKLEKARNLLTNGENNISEIVNIIGLSNRSYFSKIFKEKYGVSPKYFLNPYSENGENGENGQDGED